METLNTLTLNFNLRQPRKKGASVIYCILAVNGKQSKIPMGLKVNSWQWNKQRQQCTIAANMTDNDRANNMTVNGKLNAVRGMYDDYFVYLCGNEGKTTPTEIEQEIRERINNIVGNGNDMGRAKKIDKKKAGAFVEQLQGLINEFSKDRQRKYRKISNDLLEYMGRKHIPMEWASITKEMVYNFMCDLVSVEPLQLKTYNEKINDMFFLLNHAENHDYLINYNIKKWRNVVTKIKDDRNDDEKQSTNIILSEEQINTLYCHDFKDGAKNEVKDIYTLLCLTALGTGDLMQIWDNRFCKVEDENTLSIKRNKTKEPCQIPLNDERAKAIYHRYKNGFPYLKIKGEEKDGKITMRVQDNAKLNKILKQIIEEIGFNDVVEVTRSFVSFSNGKINVEKRKETKPICKEISMYDGRHTFITLMYYAGMPKELIKEITGHTTDEMIDRYYLKYDSEKEKANKREQIRNFYDNKGKKQTTTSSTDQDAKIIAEQARKNYELKEENTALELQREKEGLIEALTKEWVDVQQDGEQPQVLQITPSLKDSFADDLAVYDFIFGDVPTLEEYKTMKAQNLSLMDAYRKGMIKPKA